MKQLKNFFYKLYFEWLKIGYKKTQFYYTNKINDNHHSHKSVGAGKVYLFSNKISELNRIKNEMELKPTRWYNIDGHPSLMLMGSEIGDLKRRRNAYTILMLPKEQIKAILHKQKNDKI